MVEDRDMERMGIYERHVWQCIADAKRNHTGMVLIPANERFAKQANTMAMILDMHGYDTYVEKDGKYVLLGVILNGEDTHDTDEN